MIQRRARAAGIKTRTGNHTFRATGITTYLKNAGNTPRRWRTILRRGRRRFTIDARRRFRRMKWSGS